jgi:hypothetical protein
MTALVETSAGAMRKGSARQHRRLAEARKRPTNQVGRKLGVADVLPGDAPVAPARTKGFDALLQGAARLQALRHD